VEKPTFIVQPESQSIHDYRPVSTKVLVHGVPLPTIEWFKDDKPINYEAINKPGKDKLYAKEDTKKGTDQIESVLDIKSFRENDVGAVSPHSIGDLLS